MRGMFVRGGWRKGRSKRWLTTQMRRKRMFIQVDGDATPTSLTSVKWRREAAKRMMIDPS